MNSETTNDVLLPGLYIVATPIGNLGDITLRAVDVLSRCDAVACEDTRVTGKLLKHLSISKKLIRYNDHSDDRARGQLVDAMADRAIVLVSDAGTPLISDPGYRLVRDARNAGRAVTSLPGACAVIAGLTLSGLPNDRFMFAGFLPNKDKARRETLLSMSKVDATLIFYETAPRLEKSLRAIEEFFPDRIVSVAREISKLHEECRSGPASELAEHYRDNPPRGEIVLMIGPPGEQISSDEDVDRMLREALKTNKTSQAAAAVAKATGRDRKQLYDRAMDLRGE